MMEIAPPYTFSSPAPSYSRDPSADEERLAFTVRSRRNQTGKFTKKSGYTTVILHEQDERAQVPSYGRNSILRGTVCLENCVEVSRVDLKLEGWLHLSESKVFSEATKILSEKYKLWKSSSGQLCRTAVHPFNFIFPSVYEMRGRTQQLPPSCKIALPSGFAAECVYCLTVTITRTSNRLAFWRRPEILRIILDYCPRTRTPRPISAASLLSTIKPTPEEWYQIVCTTPTFPDSGIRPIACNLFIPSAQIYAYSDSIPFHLQLSAPLSSIQALFKPLPPGSPSTTNHSSLSPSNTPDSGPGTRELRVFLSREITTEVYGHKSTRTQNIGEGTVRALPPAASNVSYMASNEQEVVLDWEGEIQCLEGITGGFHTDLLAVKDYIALSLTPPTSPLLAFQHVHPIRLVTDSWELRGHPADR